MSPWPASARVRRVVWALVAVGAGCRDPHVLTGYRSPTGVNGSLRRGPHTGVDFDGDVGDDVLASADGVVESSVWSQGAGNCVLLKHSCPECAFTVYYTSYCHLDRSVVSTGRLVTRGQRIGTVGQTGKRSGGVPHVHMSLCTIPCVSGTSDGSMEGTLDPMRFYAGCFDRERSYEANTRLVLTHPVACSGK